MKFFLFKYIQVLISLRIGIPILLKNSIASLLGTVEVFFELAFCVPIVSFCLNNKRLKKTMLAYHFRLKLRKMAETGDAGRRRRREQRKGNTFSLRIEFQIMERNNWQISNNDLSIHSFLPAGIKILTSFCSMMALEMEMQRI